MLVPYPPDTRAKGWRFEVDHERIRQSDTWALASPEVRPWLLMLWMLYQRGYDLNSLRKRETETERQLRIAIEERDAERAQRLAVEESMRRILTGSKD